MRGGAFQFTVPGTSSRTEIIERNHAKLSEEAEQRLAKRFNAGKAENGTPFVDQDEAEFRCACAPKR
jgi:hypothetical protein